MYIFNIHGNARQILDFTDVYTVKTIFLATALRVTKWTVASNSFKTVFSARIYCLVSLTMVTRRKREVLEIKTADVLCNFSEGDARICGGEGFAPDDACLLEPFV